MKREVDLLKFYPKSNSLIEDRGNSVTDENRTVARKFGIDYFERQK